jgi:hypothetical protein
LGILGPRVPLALLQMSQGPSALRALKEMHQLSPALRALQVQLDLRVLQAQPGLKERRVFKAYRVFKARRVA